MRIGAIVQARLGSERLPGKSFKAINGKPLIFHVVNRVMEAIEPVYLVIPPQDESLISWAIINKIKYSLDLKHRDVLGSYYECARRYGLDVIVRVCGDNPLCDPTLIRRAIAIYIESGYDYVSNTIRRTYPVGLDVEVFSLLALERATKEAVDPYDREHVTPYIYNHPEMFGIYNFTNERDLSCLRWCVDTKEDFDHVSAIYAKMGDKTLLHYQDILELTGELCGSVS